MRQLSSAIVRVINNIPEEKTLTRTVANIHETFEAVAKSKVRHIVNNFGQQNKLQSMLFIIYFVLYFYFNLFKICNNLKFGTFLRTHGIKGTYFNQVENNIQLEFLHYSTYVVTSNNYHY